MGEGEQGVRLDGEGAGWCLYEPAAPNATCFCGKGGTPKGWDVLDDAGAIDEVELVIGERQPGSGIGAHERAGVGGPLGEVDTGDVQVGLELT